MTNLRAKPLLVEVMEVPDGSSEDEVGALHVFLGAANWDGDEFGIYIHGPSVIAIDVASGIELMAPAGSWLVKYPGNHFAVFTKGQIATLFERE